MKREYIYFFCGIAILFSCVLMFVQPEYHYDIQAQNDNIQKRESGFIYVKGQKLFLENDEYIIKGICANNAVAANPSIYDEDMMSEVDYEEIASLGFNTVRFLFNYRILEDDSNPYVYKDSGWSWIDDNIKWAEKYGIRLILDCHISQGGIPETGGNCDVWNIAGEKQKRLVAMWHAIAARYKDNKTILGYGLLNEPYIEIEDAQAWSKLAQRLVNKIRTVDKNHILIIQRAQYGKTGDFLVPQISNEDNWMLEVHKYPLIYLKMMNEYSFLPESYLYYGNQNIVLDRENTIEKGMRSNKVNARSISDEWTQVEHIIQPVAGANNAYIFFEILNVNSRQEVYISDVALHEYKNGEIGEEIYNWTYNINNIYNKYQENDTTQFEYDATNNLISISGKTDYLSFADNSCFRYFSVDETKQYYLSYKIKAIEVNARDFTVNVALKYYFSEKIYGLNREYVNKILDASQYSRIYNVPIFYGEVGVPIEILNSNRNVDNLCRDMVNWLKETDSNFTWFTWHEPNYGIFTVSGFEKKSNPNLFLLEIFRELLKE